MNLTFLESILFCVFFQFSIIFLIKILKSRDRKIYVQKLVDSAHSFSVLLFSLRYCTSPFYHGFLRVEQIFIVT